MMTQNQEILRAYLSEELEQAGYSPDASALDLLSLHISLRAGVSKESDEVRSVTIKENTDGKYSGKHFSLYNLAEVSFYDLLGLGLDAVPIAGMNGKPFLQVAYAVLKLVHKFYPKLSYNLTETDAKILVAVRYLEKKEFTLADLKASFLQQFGTTIDEARFSRAIDFFRKKFILRYKGEGIYQLRERIEYIRN